MDERVVSIGMIAFVFLVIGLTIGTNYENELIKDLQDNATRWERERAMYNEALNIEMNQSQECWEMNRYCFDELLRNCTKVSKLGEK